MAYKFFDKKKGSGAIVTSKVGKIANEVLPQESRKPESQKCKRRKVYTRLKDNNWAANLAEMKSLFSKNKGIKYLLFLIDIDVFANHASVNPLTDKKTKRVLNYFIGIINESKRKPN